MTKLEAKVVMEEGKMGGVATVRGHEVKFDQPPTWGGEDTAATPMELVLSALGACIATVAKLITQKHMQKNPKITVELEGIEQEKPPVVFTDITVKIHVEGLDLDTAKRIVAKAEEICPVGAMLKKAVPNFKVEVV